MSRSPQVDACIAKAAPFARPILEKVRRLMHRAGPGIGEALKWGMPSYVGRSIVAITPAFKAHAALIFWRERDLAGAGGFRKLTDVSQLPPDAALLKLIREALKLDAQGPAKRPPRKAKPAPKVPPPFRDALKKNPKARATFDAIPPSHRREYVEWIAEAKRPETRERRIAKALALLSKGGSRNRVYG